MKDSALMVPYGGTLVNLLVDETRQQLLKDIAMNLEDIILDERGNVRP